MSINANAQHTGGNDPSGPILALLGIAAALTAGMYAGAQLAAITMHHQLLREVSVDTMIHVATNLPKHLANPRLAWPAEYPTEGLTGPIPFWVATAVVWIASLALLFVVGRSFAGRRVGQERTPRFGAPAWSREATRADLQPLIVKTPTAGRTIFGTSKGRLLATEDSTQPGKRHPRQGDRGGVLVVGPARSGKTVIAIGAILEHDWGPVIASSVKTDLLAATIKRRRVLGEVAVFDPLDTTDGHGNTGWTPLTRCDTADGAQAAATSLVAAAPIDGSVRNADFWSQHAQRLAWVTLYAAKLGGKTMRDVVLWTSLGHQAAKTADTEPGKDTSSIAIKQILTNARARPEHRDDAELALAVIGGIWGEAEETRSGVYASAQTLFAPWEDTRIAKNSTIPNGVDLEWLYGGTGQRTLYICMPEHPKDALRFAVVFGGLIGALTDQAYTKRNRTNTALPNMLLVLDEAGNTAASWLPDLSTTCASVGITLMSFWQSLAQIQHRYGDRTNTLITNHLTKIFFGGISDPMSGDAAAKLSGSQEILTRSATTDRQSSGRRSMTENSTTSNLIPADLIRQIQPGDALCIHGTLQPIHLQTRKWWKDRGLRKRAEGRIKTDPKTNELADRLKPYVDTSIAEPAARGELPVSVSLGMTGRKEQNSPRASTQNPETDQDASSQPDQSDD
jgi:type IV secretion system protein VirD4